MTDPLGVVTCYIYDENGNLLSTTDASGNILTEYEYGATDLLMTGKGNKYTCIHADSEKQNIQTIPPTRSAVVKSREFLLYIFLQR